MLCRHFGPCGGCQTQDVPYADQLQRKRDALVRALRSALGDAAPDVGPVRGTTPSSDGQPWQFRHKAAFVFGGDARRLELGHYAAGSRRVIAIEECPVHTARANELAFALCGALARGGLRAFGYAPAGVLRHLVVRTTRDGRHAVMVLVVARNDPALRRAVRAFLRRADPPTGFLVNVHAAPGPFLFGDTSLRVHGTGRVRERIGSATYRSSPTAFFQTNPEVAEMLVSEVSSLAGSPPAGGRLLDLYSGSGLFAVALAAAGWRVTAVEDNADAVDDGTANAAANGVADRLRFVRARVEDAAGRARRAVPHVVVLDPPRSGCPPEVLRVVFEALAPPRAIYVSCNPEALAAELPFIVRAGYRVARVQPFDMFPHTLHVETVVLLNRHTTTRNAECGMRN